MAAAPALAQAVKQEREGKQPPHPDTSGAEEQRWRPFLDLPCKLTVDLPVPGFRVKDFLGLSRGSVVSTHWRVTQDLPIRVNGTLIAWAELEGASTRLAVRLTELA